jgi:hypothetical protein
VVELPFAADSCPCVEKLRTVLPLTVGIRAGEGEGGAREPTCSSSGSVRSACDSWSRLVTRSFHVTNASTREHSRGDDAASAPSSEPSPTESRDQ